MSSPNKPFKDFIFIEYQDGKATQNIRIYSKDHTIPAKEFRATNIYVQFGCLFIVEQDKAHDNTHAFPLSGISEFILYDY